MKRHKRLIAEPMDKKMHPGEYGHKWETKSGIFTETGCKKR